MYKVIKTIAVCVIIGGFVCMFGAVGYDDFYTLNGAYVPFSETFGKILTGAGVALAGGLLYFFTGYIQYEKGKRRNTGKASTKR